MIESNRGKALLLFQGYKFRKFRESKSAITWRCSSNKKCVASLKTDLHVTYLLETSAEHQPRHDPPTERNIEKQEVRRCIKRKATENLQTQPLKIIRKEVKSTNHITYSDVPSLLRASNRAREKLRPNESTSRQEVLQKITKVPCSSDSIIAVDEKNEIVIVTCRENIEFLMEYGEVILADGTFAYAPKYFKQTYTVHVFCRGFYVHVATFFLPSKHKKTYIAMWSLLKTITFQVTNSYFQVQKIMLDFEISALSGMQHVFPNAVPQGCKFHLGQSWWKRIHQIPTLRKAYYIKAANDSNSYLFEVKKWLQLFFSLSYLPPSHVPEAFTEIFSIAPDIPEAGSFADYVLRNYIESNTFPPSLWACASTDFTTTNGAESYNSKLQGEFYYHHPHAPTAVEQIFEAQSFISLKIKSVRESEIFKPRKPQRVLAESIQVNIDLYLKGKMEILEFLEAIRDVRHPPQPEIVDPGFVFDEDEHEDSD